MLKNSELRLVLQTADGRMVFGDPIDDRIATKRDSRETHLPWTLQVASLNPPGDRAPFENRRQLYLAGLVLLLAVIAAGSYFIGRSVTRELAVARLQSDFVAAVSHEFRTPLTSLRQVTELLSDGRQSDPSRLSSYYQTQTRAADRLQRLVESLLDFGKMEAGAKLYRMQIIDICDWLRTTIQEMQSDDALGQYHIELQCESDGLGRVNADPEALARALRNLIDNAVKYSPDCRTVWVSLTRQDNRLAIRVRDRGIGIPANERKQIFRKFVRGAAAKTNGIKGTGVGLAMVQQIVLAHGGEVQLESQSGLGSTFTILLPEGRN
jgi:signal transduction histidine kinase